MALRRIAATALILTLTVPALAAESQLTRGDRYAGLPWATRSPVLAQHGMAATEQPLASQIAIDVLKKGGSAVDAAIAANAAIGLMQPVLNGIGGDLFAIVWDPKTKQLYGYNGSGRSAQERDLAKLTVEVEAAWKKAGMPVEAHIPPLGSLSITVPGTVDAWFALHEKFGKLPIGDDLAPAIGYAMDGFPVTQLIAKYWNLNMAAFDKRAGLIEELDNARATYLVNGHAPEEGEVFRNPDLAHTLSLIAKGGRDAFYKGRDRPHDRRLFPAGRRRSALCRFRRASGRVGDAAFGELPRLRRL
jgi:gamma-glutamyltranspeptidase/glutathione hydrolase